MLVHYTARRSCDPGLIEDVLPGINERINQMSCLRLLFSHIKTLGDSSTVIVILLAYCFFFFF